MAIKTKKKSRQVRIDEAWHHQLKVYAATNGMTITRVIGKVCKSFFEEQRTRAM